MRRTFPGFAFWLSVLTAVVVVAPPAVAQFGGRAGDLVLYAVTSKGGAQLARVAPGTRNDAALAARFRVVDSATVSIEGSDPFPLKRRPLFEDEGELFGVGEEDEGVVGLQRLFTAPVKVLVLEGAINPVGNFYGHPSVYVSYPVGLDVAGDLVVEQFKVVTWAGSRWPFMVRTNQPGPARPPDIPGYEFLVSDPNRIKVPALMPWTPLWRATSQPGWPDGVDIKILDADSQYGVVARFLRLRPGRSTPLFRIEGHTHLFVLQGSAQLTPANGTTVTLEPGYYAYVPGGFALRVANPAPYRGPGSGFDTPRDVRSRQ